MIDAREVKKLAHLSRLALTDSEVEKLRSDMDSIIAYIDTIRKVSLPEKPAESPYLELENVTRDDANPHAPRAYTEALMAQAPRREGNYLKVKKILEQ